MQKICSSTGYYQLYHSGNQFNSLPLIHINNRISKNAESCLQYDRDNGEKMNTTKPGIPGAVP